MVANHFPLKATEMESLSQLVSTEDVASQASSIRTYVSSNAPIPKAAARPALAVSTGPAPGDPAVSVAAPPPPAPSVAVPPAPPPAPSSPVVAGGGLPVVVAPPSPSWVGSAASIDDAELSGIADVGLGWPLVRGPRDPELAPAKATGWTSAPGSGWAVELSGFKTLSKKLMLCFQGNIWPDLL
jgi:hypothetical protein